MIRDLWYKNMVVYNLDIDTFMDTDGDGVGDFEGLMRQLPYLRSLGIDAVWLSPFQPSPNRDNGYDIFDYYGVDPRHGSSGDFVEFIRTATQLGIKVLIDLVVNHTSDQHRWFQEARRDKSSPYRNWYIWSKERPPNWNQGMVFPGVEEACWTYDEQAGEYYFHRFYHFQPDLNIDNRDVRTEIQRIMGYWLQLGVHGFRMDAVPFLIESVDPNTGTSVLKFEYLHDLRDFLQWRQGDGVMLGEVNVLPDDARKYFGEARPGIHMMFNFYVNQHLFYALATAETGPLIDALRATRGSRPTAQWAYFLRNHDELDLGRLTHEQREKVFARFGPDKHMQLYHRGIRRRLASMLGDQRHIKLANSLLFSLPGTPVLYYGDEIGMGDNLSLQERNSVRTPMQWSDERQAGFSTASETVRPVIDEGSYGYQRVKVEDQRRDPDSLLNWTAQMIRLRKECPEIGWGDWEILETGSESVLAMQYDWLGNSLVIVHNFAEQPQKIRIDPGVDGGTLVDLHADEQIHARESGQHHLTLDGHDYRWYRVGSLKHILERPRK